MKTNNVIFGKGSGRVGATLNRIVHGVQIEGAMPSKMTNPNTDAQQDTRARFKLASQLSAIMKNVIAIPRDGLRSGRNIFTSKVFDITELVDGVASVDLNAVQLTNSIRPFGDLTIDRSAGSSEPMAVTVETAAGRFDRVVVVGFRKDSEDNLVSIGSDSKVADPSGVTTGLELPYTADEVVVYAYGISYKSTGAKSKYDNISAKPAEEVAKLANNTSAYGTSTKFSATIGLTMAVGEDDASTKNGIATCNFTLPSNQLGNKTITFSKNITLLDLANRLSGATNNGPLEFVGGLESISIMYDGAEIGLIVLNAQGSIATITEFVYRGEVTELAIEGYEMIFV